ncbi:MULTISPECIES: hypothetical protein [Streptomyces]|uniref:Transposase IS4-like domain-containing protein n=1 Tax=Streptomyces avermitilis TaxID=33903 RepID=A0A4D4N6G1_STRAX|nr:MULTISPECIES: hypothetical protein [Streptomyces]BBJ48427.1 hypothetical protein SAVMC3_10560 [Streptomyces avermitilis]GDY79466.1 hypothetical protein SAV31267_089510 [Streptomyces avermitilis]
MATAPAGLRVIAVDGKAHTHSGTGHGRRESRAIKTCSIADRLGGIAFAHAKLALCVHRHRRLTGKRETRESIYSVTSLDAHQTSPADLAAAIRGHWGVENSSHHIRTSPSPRTPPPSTPAPHPAPWPPSAPRAMAAFRNLAIDAFKASKPATSPRPPGPSATNLNEPSGSWASPTTRTPMELDQALPCYRSLHLTWTHA